MEKVLKLEELIDIFLDDEYLDVQPIIPMIDDLRKNLESSPVSSSKHRLGMLLNDIKHKKAQLTYTSIQAGSNDRTVQTFPHIR